MNGTVCKAPLIPPELHPPLGKVLPQVGPVEIDVPCAGGDAVRNRVGS